MPSTKSALASVLVAILITVASVVPTLLMPSPTATSASAVSLVRSDFAIVDPVISPDGKRIAFASNATGNFDLWIMDSNGRHRTRLTDLPGDERYPRFDSTGHLLAFLYSLRGSSSLFIVAADGHEMAHFLGGSQVGDTFSWNPVTRELAYEELQEGGRFTVVSEVTEAYALRQTVRLNGIYASWSADGGMIAYVSDNATTSSILVFREANGTTEELFGSTETLLSPHFVVNDTRLVFLSGGAGNWSLVNVDLSSGESRDLLQPWGGSMMEVPRPIGLTSQSAVISRPGGKELFFVAHSFETGEDIFQCVERTTVVTKPGAVEIVDYFGTRIAPLTKESASWVSPLSWSNDGSYLVFAQRDFSGFYQLTLLRYSPSLVRSAYG